MKILLSPQINESEKIYYQYQGEKIVVTIGNTSDEFDFTNMPDGVIDNIETTLPFNPILSAKRENGQLIIQLLNFIDMNATDYERFPSWQVK